MSQKEIVLLPNPEPDSIQKSTIKDNHRSKIRKRKKQTYNAIRNQMHFYFSDSNLSKDRFLKQLISENADVPLDVFMSFNRIKKLANSIKDIETALLSSDMLELSDNRKCVHRITEMKEKENVDEYTIYVEALPISTTHDWLRNVFKTFGPIAYVSLPKYRTSGRIKEFAFVEFENRSSVQKAVKAFQQMDGFLGSDTNPAELLSITSFVNEHTAGVKVDGKTDAHVGDETDARIVGEEYDKDGLSNIDEQSEAATVSETMGDLTDISDVDGGGGENSDDCMNERPKKVVKLNETIGGSKCRNDDDIDEEDESEDDADMNDSEIVNKRKTRRKKSAAKQHHKAKEKEAMDNALNTLRVTTKIEWKRLRNKYLNLQRQQISLSKRLFLVDKRKNRPTSAHHHHHLTKKKDITSTTPTQTPSTAATNPRNINFYGANPDNESDHQKIDNKFDPVPPIPIERKPLFSYEPGIIVKIFFDVPCVTVKDFKAEMRQYPFVRYVDVNEGDMAAYIRVDQPRSAPTLIKHCAPRRCQILTNENAEAYWLKIERDREAKLNKTVKIRAKRGREKIIKQISMHIRFED